MSIRLYHEATTQFLARMLLATREGQQINREDATRLSDLAAFGPQDRLRPVTMPEGREDPSGLRQAEVVH